MMTMNQQISEIVELADVSVRVASQLRAFKNGRPVRDSQSLENAEAFLEAAIEGGQFVSTGNAAGLQSSLSPLNWAADVRFPTTTGSSLHPDDLAEYERLVEFLQKVRGTLNKVQRQESPDSDGLDDSILFFQQLGKTLGTRADQKMRLSSGVLRI